MSETENPRPADTQPPATDAVEELGEAFKLAMGAVRRLRGRETHRSGALSHAQYGLLFGLARGGEKSARELAEAADLTPATVTQMLEALETAGLVQRIRSDRDRRVVLTSLTDRGSEVVAEHRTRAEEGWREALDGFTSEELAAASAVLRSLVHYFDRLADSDPRGRN